MLCLVFWPEIHQPSLKFIIQMTYYDDKDSKTVLLVSLVFKVTFSSVTGYFEHNTLYM